MGRTRRASGKYDDDVGCDAHDVRDEEAPVILSFCHFVFERLPERKDMLYPTILVYTIPYYSGLCYTLLVAECQRRSIFSRDAAMIPLVRSTSAVHVFAFVILSFLSFARIKGYS
jgi:hypothetical protein